MNAAAPLQRFRLVDDFTARYLKFNGREPRTLSELAIARADLEHRRRLAEIKALEAKLALLDAHLPALAERGVSLANRELNTHDGGKTIRVFPPFSSSSDDSKLLASLLSLGFREIERRHRYGDNWSVKVKHGRWLVVDLDIKTPAPVAATPAPEAATA